MLHNLNSSIPIKMIMKSIRTGKVYYQQLLRKFNRSALKVIYSIFKIRSSSLLLKKIMPACEHINALKSVDKSFGFFLDVGANKGQFLLIANLICPNKYFYIFEPLSQEIQSTLTYLNNHSVKFNFYDFGLGNVCRKKLRFNTAIKSDCSSFLEPTQAALAKKNGKFLKTLKVTEVIINDLDAVLLNDDVILDGSFGFMKIDTQGTELDVIKGGKHFIRKYIKYIYVEVSDVEHYSNQTTAAEIHDFLDLMDFEFVESFNVYKRLSGELAYADVLYVNSKII